MAVTAAAMATTKDVYKQRVQGYSIDGSRLKLTTERINAMRFPPHKHVVKKPNTNSAAVKAVATMNDQFIHPTAFLYVASPFFRSWRSTFCTEVFSMLHTSMGSNEKSIFGEEQYVISSTPPAFLPSQYDQRPTR